MVKCAVFGLGFVGHATAMGLVKRGYDVMGYDIDPVKIQRREYHASMDPKVAVEDAQMIFVCVPTPVDCNLAHVEFACDDIKNSLKYADNPLIVIRSTVLPGSTMELKERIENVVGEGEFRICHNPEFLREKHAQEDFDNPLRILIGCENAESVQPLLDFYEKFAAPKYIVPIEVAEAVKYTDNAFHACKAAFANEMGRLWWSKGIDAELVMDIVSDDKRLNCSDKYLKPGWAFGGHCLPKDLQALRSLDHPTPLLDGIWRSNELQKEEDDKRNTNLLE